MPALTAGDIFMGGHAGSVILMASRLSPAGPPTRCEQRETYLQVRGSSRYSAAEYKGVGNKRMTKNERDRRKDMHINGYQIIGGFWIIVALFGYVWWMAAQVVPTTMELASVLGMSVSAPAAWIVLTTIALLLALGVGRADKNSLMNVE